MPMLGDSLSALDSARDLVVLHEVVSIQAYPVFSGIQPYSHRLLQLGTSTYFNLHALSSKVP